MNRTVALKLPVTFAAAVFLLSSLGPPCAAQDYEQYRPLPLPVDPVLPEIQQEPLPPIEGSDRVLVDALDAVLILDDQAKIKPDDALADLTGLHHDFAAGDSLVYSPQLAAIVEGYFGGPITLRRLNELSRDLIEFYRDRGQPVVDIVIPEQKITAGTVQLVVIESRVGRVCVEGGCFFDPCDLRRWVVCTQPGARVYESAISRDLFWLNQSPFRRVDVDLRPGEFEGTTDVIFESTDVRPLNGYIGYEDTGVRTLMLERLYGGVIWGNAFGRGGTLSYQYTSDVDFRHLDAHAVSYLEPLNHCWSFHTYGSWAGVDPILPPGLDQRGESWQAGVGMIRHLTKNRYEDTSLSFGFDFKSTDNNLEFGGIRVSDSSADLAQLRAGWQQIRRFCRDEYSILGVDLFVGPGEGFTSNATTAAFNTVRPGTSPDYVYARGRAERLWELPRRSQVVARLRGQINSERLLFSETLGFGGYDSVRGYDQRVFSGDSGWIANVEFGPRPWRWCYGRHKQTLRLYGLIDAGGAYIEAPLQGEIAQEHLVSAGVGLRWSFGDRAQLRIDYAHGIEDVVFAQGRDRIHIGFVTLFGPRP